MRKAEREAYEEAARVLTRSQAEADLLKIARTKATLGALLDRWLPQHELDATTRMNYSSQIRNYIKPALGASGVQRRGICRRGHGGREGSRE